MEIVNAYAAVGSYLINQYGEGPFWGLGIDGIRHVLAGLNVPDALRAAGLDARGAPLRDQHPGDSLGKGGSTA